MSTLLSLRVHKIMMGEQALSGAVADIVPISGDEGAKAYRGIIIPVSGSDTQEIEVAPGRYLVRAYLPSGTLLTEQVNALPNQTTPAVLKAEQTPHEWLGWQDLVRQRSRADKSESISRPATGWAFIDVKGKPTDWAGLQQLVQKRSPISTGDVVQALQGQPTPGLKVQNFEDAGNSSCVIQTGNALPMDRLRYGVVDRGSAVEVVSLPLPWHRQDRRYGSVESSIDITIPDSGQQRAGVVVHDSELGSLLGFVASGRLPFATALGTEGTPAHQQMSKALYDKVTNPVAAAVGAFLLLKSDPTPSAEWHEWVTNLASWFPWLPDGEVLRGTLCMRVATTDEDVTAARDAFDRAWRRGIPVLAPVLRLLLDGMTTLVDDPDAEAGDLESLLPAVRAVAGAMATDQAFTTLRLGERT